MQLSNTLQQQAADHCHDTAARTIAARMNKTNNTAALDAARKNSNAAKMNNAVRITRREERR